MANEIQVTVAVSVAKNELKMTIPSTTRKSDLTGDQLMRDVMSVPTTAAGTAIDIASVGTEGLAIFTNVDATNFIEVGLQVAGTFYGFLQLYPGQQAVCWISDQALYARADTAAALLDFQIVER